MMPNESLYQRISKELNPDECMVDQKMYDENPKLYDQIQASIYIFRYPNQERLDVAFASDLKRVHEAYGEGEEPIIFKELLIVRKRLPWREVNYEWLDTPEAVKDRMDDWQIVDTYFKVLDKETQKSTMLIGDKKLQANRDRYEILEQRHLVRWRSSKRSKIKGAYKMLGE